ncbi:hypothetical protein cyc_04857 [Cyclospora cayetanensis]|uniref:Uncharacterized protein n=1 Tax=Cyclospora cayetanensis TaxID=88456 RepID=A0A1D3D0X8_9EIME|nr:hypothetical protein cyc_04857 [Cyclospora cayetanensis]
MDADCFFDHLVPLSGGGSNASGDLLGAHSERLQPKLVDGGPLENPLPNTADEFLSQSGRSSSEAPSAPAWSSLVGAPSRTSGACLGGEVNAEDPLVQRLVKEIREASGGGPHAHTTVRECMPFRVWNQKQVALEQTSGEKLVGLLGSIVQKIEHMIAGVQLEKKALLEGMTEEARRVCQDIEDRIATPSNEQSMQQSSKLK